MPATKLPSALFFTSFHVDRVSIISSNVLLLLLLDSYIHTWCPSGFWETGVVTEALKPNCQSRD